MKCFRLLLSAILASFFASAQFTPAENDTLNYRLAAFTAPQNAKAYQYQFEIAAGIYNNNTFFEQNIVSKYISKKNSTVQTLPALGKPYTWRLVYLSKKGKELGKSDLVHFYTGSIPYTDTARYRLRIKDTATDHQDLFVFCDRMRTLYNMRGEPLWFIPNIPGIIDDNTSVRDLKVTPFNTITFLINDKAFEINYNGKILWTPPNDGKISGDTSEYYHHEFTRLENGNYMIAGNEKVKRELKDVSDTSFIRRNGMIEKQGDKYFYTLSLGTIIEYDTTKNIVWSWKSSSIFTDADLFTKKTPRGELVASTHQNSFFFDKKRNCIYTSFRDINRIVKIEYPTGKVLAQYGENYQKDPTILADGFFYGQHCCKVSANGDLYLFNNNFKGRGTQNQESPSAITIIGEPQIANSPAKLLWEYKCMTDDQQPLMATAGGSVTELEDGCILVCLGSINRVFIVNRKKQIIWDAYTEMKTNNIWQPIDSYRSSYILKNSLLKLTLNTD
jgi:hypothetical protein